MDVVENSNHLLIEITGQTDADEVRRVSYDLTRQAALDESVAERASLIASEAAANILKHAGQGQMLMRVAWETGPVVEIIALDNGPGITALSVAMRGSHSTSGASGASGIGLCAMSRASNFFDIYSRPGQGTALLAQVWGGQSGHCPATRDPYRDAARPRVKSGAISTAKPGSKPGFHTGSRMVARMGSRMNNDAWSVKHQPSRSLVMVADGLGQGAEAARAAAEAVRVIERVHSLAPAEILEVAHETLRPTRGASVAVAEIRLLGVTPEVRFAGIGNIAARVVGAGAGRHLVSMNGIAGYEAEIEQFTYPWPAHSALVMHSDGLLAQWNAGDYPGLLNSHPALIAAVLHRDFNRGLDDATVVVAKQ